MWGWLDGRGRGDERRGIGDIYLSVKNVCTFMLWLNFSSSLFLSLPLLPLSQIFFDYNNWFPTVINADFISNSATQDGGAMYARNTNTGITLNRSRFRSNRASTYGGAFALAAFNSGVVVRHCVFEQNSALDGGGAVHLFNGNGVLGQLTTDAEVCLHMCIRVCLFAVRCVYLKAIIY